MPSVEDRIAELERRLQEVSQGRPPRWWTPEFVSEEPPAASQVYQWNDTNKKWRPTSLSGLVTTGIIAMWSGTVATIPTGWLLCDGTNGTPDLRDNFVKGAASGADAGATGGAATHTHTGHSNHAFTQPSAHSNHSNHAFTQPGAHSNHAFTQPSDHAQKNTGIPSAVTSVSEASPSAQVGSSAHTHSVSVYAHSGGAVDAHSAHSGGAVDAHSAHSAHSGGAVDAHSAHDSPNSEPPHYAILFIMKS